MCNWLQRNSRFHSGSCLEINTYQHWTRLNTGSSAFIWNTYIYSSTAFISAMCESGRSVLIVGRSVFTRRIICIEGAVIRISCFFLSLLVLIISSIHFIYIYIYSKARWCISRGLSCKYHLSRRKIIASMKWLNWNTKYVFGTVWLVVSWKADTIQHICFFNIKSVLWIITTI